MSDSIADDSKGSGRRGCALVVEVDRTDGTRCLVDRFDETERGHLRRRVERHRCRGHLTGHEEAYRALILPFPVLVMVMSEEEGRDREERERENRRDDSSGSASICVSCASRGHFAPGVEGGAAGDAMPSITIRVSHRRAAYRKTNQGSGISSALSGAAPSAGTFRLSTSCEVMPLSESAPSPRSTIGMTSTA
jgi:hypothetical protein